MMIFEDDNIKFILLNGFEICLRARDPRFQPSFRKCQHLLIGNFFDVQVFLFGTLTEWLKLYSVYYYMVLWIASGFVQSSGWPTEVCVMGNWFGKSMENKIV